MKTITYRNENVMKYYYFRRPKNCRPLQDLRKHTPLALLHTALKFAQRLKNVGLCKICENIPPCHFCTPQNEFGPRINVGLCKICENIPIPSNFPQCIPLQDFLLRLATTFPPPLHFCTPSKNESKHTRIQT